MRLLKIFFSTIFFSFVLTACTNEREVMLETQVNNQKAEIQRLKDQLVDLKSTNSGLQQQLTTAKQGRIPTGVIAVQTGGLYDRVQEGTAVSTSGSGYAHALQLYRAGDIDNAEIAFKEFISSGGGQTEEIALANYWLADAAYNRRNYERAIGYFALSLKQSPNGEKSQAAMSRLVQTLKESGRAQDAAVLEQNGIAALQIDE